MDKNLHNRVIQNVNGLLWRCLAAHHKISVAVFCLIWGLLNLLWTLSAIGQRINKPACNLLVGQFSNNKKLGKSNWVEDALFSIQSYVLKMTHLKHSFYHSHWRFVHLVVRCVWTYTKRLLFLLMIYTIAVIFKEQNSVIQTAFLLVVTVVL